MPGHLSNQHIRGSTFSAAAASGHKLQHCSARCALHEVHVLHGLLAQNVTEQGQRWIMLVKL